LGRRLGQHFLTASYYLERIAAAACPEPEPLVIEIGPGRGALTASLIPRAKRLVAIELDAGLAHGLREAFPQVTVIEADVLEVDLGQWGPAVVAGNLPYYITSPILEKLFSMGTALRRAVVLVQLEVAERLTALPGSRDYGYLTVMAQVASTPRLLFRVPPGAFSPPPKVDSAAVLLEPREHPPAAGVGFLEFAGRAFRQKRKTLKNNLAAQYPAIAGMPEASLRAEQLSVEQLLDLYARLARRPQ